MRYYPTRTEMALMQAHLPAIKDVLGENIAIFEYGSGASEKIRLLIESLPSLKAYVAMDISKSFLLESAQALAQDYPHLSVSAVCADFNQTITLPADFHPEITCWTGYFPGSTLGNFSPEGAVEFMRNARQTLGANGQFLLGVDLEKDVSVLEQAYNDHDGITAKFNKNLLERMKFELGANLDVTAFEHTAFYNAAARRIEMHLMAVKSTTIEIEDQEFSFVKGETILTEYSHKYTPESLRELVGSAGWAVREMWFDEKEWFMVCLLSNDAMVR